METRLAKVLRSFSMALGLGDKRAELQRSIKLAISLKRVESIHHCIIGQKMTILHVEPRLIFWMHRPDKFDVHRIILDFASQSFVTWTIGLVVILVGFGWGSDVAAWGSFKATGE